MKNLNFKEILGKAHEMQSHFQDMQKAFEKTEILGTAGIEEEEEQIYVKALIDGKRRLKNLEIGEGAFKSGKEVMIELILNAVNNATEKLNEEIEGLNKKMQGEIKKIYNLPGMPGGEEEGE